MPKDKLTGDDVLVARVLEKVELAVRRADHDAPVGMSADLFASNLASQLAQIVKDMYND